MSLTIFLAICILGCDLLIYFLYEWAFGESKRIRKHYAQSRSRLWAQPANIAPAQPSHGKADHSTGARVVKMQPQPAKPSPRPPQENTQNEILAYRRLAASFGQLKPRT
jgi:hypothetical protein